MNLFTTLNPIDLFQTIRRFNAVKTELLRLIENHDVPPYPLNDRITHALHGSINLIDAHLLKLILRKYKPKTILEIGSFLGFSTRWMLEISSEWGAAVTAVDPNIRHRIFDNPRAFVEGLNSEFYPDALEIETAFFADSGLEVYYDYEHYEPKRDRQHVDELLKNRGKIDGSGDTQNTWNRRFDFIFIDGNHAYEQVIGSVRNALPLLNQGGCIAFHDVFTWPGVQRALNELEIEYKGKAEVTVHGRLDNFVLRTFLNKKTDGIGLFRLLDQ